MQKIVTIFVRSKTSAHAVCEFDGGRSWLLNSVNSELELKSNPNFPIDAQKVTKLVFSLKVTYFRIAHKVAKYLG